MKWLVFRTPAQKEFVANKVFENQGYHDFTVRIKTVGGGKGTLVKPALNRIKPNVLVPTVVKTARVRGRRRSLMKIYASVPSYIVFAYPSDMEIPWCYLNRFRPNLLSKAVGIEGKAIVFSDKVIEPWLEKSGQTFNFENTPNPHQAFNVGELVRVVAGPLEGQQFPVEDIRGSKARGLVNILGGLTVCEVALEDLRAA